MRPREKGKVMSNRIVNIENSREADIDGVLSEPSVEKAA
jgi:hypothetical protein